MALDAICLTAKFQMFAYSVLTVGTQLFSCMPGIHIELNQVISDIESLQVQLEVQNLHLQQLVHLPLQHSLQQLRLVLILIFMKLVRI